MCTTQLARELPEYCSIASILADAVFFVIVGARIFRSAQKSAGAILHPDCQITCLSNPYSQAHVLNTSQNPYLCNSPGMRTRKPACEPPGPETTARRCAFGVRSPSPPALGRTVLRTWVRSWRNGQHLSVSPNSRRISPSSECEAMICHRFSRWMPQGKGSKGSDWAPPRRPGDARTAWDGWNPKNGVVLVSFHTIPKQGTRQTTQANIVRSTCLHVSACCLKA